MKIQKALRREKNQQKNHKPHNWNSSDELRRKDVDIKRKRKEKLQKQLED